MDGQLLQFAMTEQINWINEVTILFESFSPLFKTKRTDWLERPNTANINFMFGCMFPHLIGFLHRYIAWYCIEIVF